MASYHMAKAAFNKGKIFGAARFNDRAKEIFKQHKLCDRYEKCEILEGALFAEDQEFEKAIAVYDKLLKRQLKKASANKYNIINNYIHSCMMANEYLLGKEIIDTILNEGDISDSVYYFTILHFAYSFNDKELFVRWHEAYVRYHKDELYDKAIKLMHYAYIENGDIKDIKVMVKQLVEEIKDIMDRDDIAFISDLIKGVYFDNNNHKEYIGMMSSMLSSTQK